MLKKSAVTVFTLIVTIVSCVIMAMACGNPDGEGKDSELTNIFADNIEIDYDGLPHSITILNPYDSDEIYYSTSENGDWYAINPTFTNVGEYTVYYKVVRKGCADYISCATVTINKQILSDISANDIKYIYDGKAHGIIIKGTEIGDKITYSIDGEEFLDECKQTGVGEYTVYYRVERENGEYRSSARLTILPNLQGKYLNRDEGIIILTANTAIINNEELKFDYDVNGNGNIGAERVGLDNGALSYQGKEYEKISDGEFVYKLNINENIVYVKGEDSIEVGITFEQETATVKVDSYEVLQINGVNYCESAEQREYTTSNVVMSFQAKSSDEITNCEIILSCRNVREAENISELVMFDGKEHSISVESGITVMYIIDGEYTLEPPKYKEVGTYTIHVVYIEDECLPVEITATLVIAPCIDGLYYNNNGLIVIKGKTVSINGVQSELEYKDNKWYIEGKAVVETEDGIKIGAAGAQYKKRINEDILVFAVDGQYYVITERIYEITIWYDEESGEVIVNDHDGDELIRCMVGKNGITVTVSDDEMDIIRQDGSMYLYLIGESDIDQDLPIIYIISNKP